MKDTDESVAICSSCFEPITSEIYHPVDCFLFDVILPKGKSYKFALPRRVPSEPRDITTHLIVWEKKQKRISNICPKCYIKQIMVRYLVTRESKRHIEENELANRHSGSFSLVFFEAITILEDLRQYWQIHFPELVELIPTEDTLPGVKQKTDPIIRKRNVDPIIANQIILEFITQRFPERVKDPSRTYEQILKELFLDQVITVEKIAEVLGWTIEEADQYINRIIPV